ncbi:MAG: hypothetical protein KF764_33110 [Labilithrix sp.]|nr:hypothetical protein [Labilithrix sp.]
MTEGADADVDVRADGAPGAPFDAHEDAATEADAGKDALAADIFVGKWHALPGAPSYCDIRVSEEPEKLASKWQPCPSGRQGCRKLDTTWTKHPPSAPGLLVDVSKGPEPTRLIGDKAYFMIRRYWHSEVFLLNNQPIGYMYLLEPLDEAPSLAIATGPIALVKNSPRYCAVAVGYGDFGAAYDLTGRDPTKPATQDNGSDEVVLGWAPWATLGTFTTKTVNVTEFGLGSKIGYFLDPALGETTLWVSTRAPSSVGIFNFTSQSARLLEGNLRSEYPTPAPGGAFVFDTSTSAFAIAHAKDDGTFTRVVTPASPQVVTWKALDRSNGNALVWVESDSGLDYTNSTLWTAPFATTEASLVRRKVAKLEDSTFSGGGGGVANRGVFLSLSGRNEATITRLSDGMGWKVTGEPGERFTAPIWVDDNEAILQIAPDPDGKFQLDSYGIVRIARSTLGPPTVPSGL